MDANMAGMLNDEGELELEEDNELNLGNAQPTVEELEVETAAEPAMMKAATVWDNFLELKAEVNTPWAAPADDTDDYRKQRALDVFNKANVVARDLHALNPEISGWVLHVLCFIVPRQYVPMGDPTRRSCEACEALGASMKKIIRHLTCRRRVTSQYHTHNSADGKKLWAQTFKRGYVVQTFRRVCVRAELLHGETNAPYLQRADHRLLKKGKVAVDKAPRALCAQSMSCVEAMSAPFVFSKEAALALWS